MLMKYLDTDVEVRKFASLLHLLPPEELPSLVVLGKAVQVDIRLTPG